MALRSPQ